MKNEEKRERIIYTHVLHGIFKPVSSKEYPGLEKWIDMPFFLNPAKYKVRNNDIYYELSSEWCKYCIRTFGRAPEFGLIKLEDIKILGEAKINFN
jgi:hypothetical protein